MDLTFLLAIMAGIVALAAAIKALPFLWNTAKSITKFMSGIEMVASLPVHLENQQKFIEAHSGIPELLSNIAAAVDALSKELRDHMLEEERMREEEKRLVERLVRAASMQDSIVFRQTTFSSDVAYYEMKRDTGESEWYFDWCNASWSKLTGLSITEARVVGWTPVISDEERDIVLPQIVRAGLEGLPLDIEFKLVNYETKEKNMVRVIGYPIMQDSNGKYVRYLGAIYVLEG